MRNEPPDGIIVTVSKGMIGDNGYRHWLRNFLEVMGKGDELGWNYYFRVSRQPKYDEYIRHVYLCIGGKIRFRVFYAGSEPAGKRRLTNGKNYRIIDGKGWILTAGPVERPPMVIERKGFQGFRYTNQLW